MATTNLAQLGFVLRLLGHYLPTMARYLDIARPCVRAACDRFIEVSLAPRDEADLQIRASPAKRTMANIEALLLSLVKVSSRIQHGS